MTSEQREGFLLAVDALADVFAGYQSSTDDVPVLVGGGAVILLTAGRFFSGDFDFIAADIEAMDVSMRRLGFREEDRVGHLRIGWYHADLPMFGFQQVSGRLFDGRCDLQRCLRIPIRPSVWMSIPAAEDVIADRLAQHSVASPTDASMLLQARAVLALAPDIDRAYLEKRVREEGGELALLVQMHTDNVDSRDHPIEAADLSTYWSRLERQASSADLLAPAASLGMRNSGDRRTEAKVELLERILERGGPGRNRG